MKKSYLIKAEPKSIYRALSDTVQDTYNLAIKTVWLFGLFTTTKVIEYDIMAHQDYAAILNHWDELIESQMCIG